jgi:hypothetical protein
MIPVDVANLVIDTTYYILCEDRNPRKLTGNFNFSFTNDDGSIHALFDDCFELLGNGDYDGGPIGFCVKNDLGQIRTTFFQYLKPQIERARLNRLYADANAIHLDRAMQRLGVVAEPLNNFLAGTGIKYHKGQRIIKLSR